MKAVLNEVDKIIVRFPKSVASLVIILIVDVCALTYILLCVAQRTEKNNLLDNYSIEREETNRKNVWLPRLAIILLMFCNLILFIAKLS